ncbi:MAG: hypothetical protein LBO81_00795 [Clostridiales Family XIII bacterium]|jgi:hypothetical protein|nr:hypothetical protein [Clostridiales Family XIII bacterium]
MMGRGGGGGGSGGGGGGGRSFGSSGSGSRSFGHVSSSSRGGSSPGRGRGGGGNGWGGGSGGGGWHRERRWSRSYGGYNDYGHRRGYGGRRTRSGVSAIVTLAFVVLMVFILTLFNNSRSAVPASTYEREPLGKGLAAETAYLKDDAHWIDNVREVERAMKYFYDKTGVRPYLWIAESLGGSSYVTDDEANAALNDLYDAEISDEAHIVVLFLETSDSDYDIYYVAGSAAKTVMDQEACDILMNYFIKYYTRDYDDNEYFSQVFRDTADRIMSKTVSTGVIAFGGVAGIVVLVVLLLFITSMVKKGNERKRLNAEILNTPIDRDDAFDIQDEAEKKAKEYE